VESQCKLPKVESGALNDFTLTCCDILMDLLLFDWCFAVVTLVINSL